MAPVKANKPAEINPWGWVTSVKPEDVRKNHILSAYRVTGFQPCVDGRRNCKRNPHCLFGLGERKWREDNDGDDEQEGAAFRCEGEYAGLQNLGATCYVNSLLQLWFHNPIFSPAILKWTPGTLPIDSGDYKPSCPLAQLQAIFARLKISKRSKIDPSDFVSSLLLNTGEQQDAQEFAKLFMDFIVKLLTDYGDEQIRGLIAQSFNGQLQYEMECLGCKNLSQRSEGFTELNLSVKKNLSESLDELLADEIISDDYMCSNCHKKNTAKRRMQLVTLPPILNLQLLRFVYDREAGRRKKVTQNISFPEVLEMQNRIYGITPETCDLSKYKYHLTAVLIHNGQSASSGHYVAQIKDLRTGEWLKFNDEFVDPVSKNRPQKAKDEDSDNEKKSKQKKSKNSPSLNSTGAYMLVYTLDQHIQRPEPDPELHQYLIDLVKQEDALFEKEVNKNKSEKDFELAVRNQRRKEVEWLYELRKGATDVKRDTDSDVENEEGPKKKIARYEEDIAAVENSFEKMDEDDCSVSTTNNHQSENHTSTNGIGAEVSVLPKRKKQYELEESDFVSVDWIMQWLDPVNPVPPVENGMLLCDHKKLAPPSPTVNPCLYRIVPSPLAGVWYEHYQGGPRLKAQDVCDICVQAQCRKLRALAELDEDSKQVAEITKKFEFEVAQYTKAGQSIPEEMKEGKVWITKDSFKKWKRLAKRSIEGLHPDETSSKAKSPDDMEIVGSSEEGLDADETFNADLVCAHGGLSQDGNSRKMIPTEAWIIIAKYFLDPFRLDVAGSTNCDECRNEEQATTLALAQHKEVAGEQKAGLSELFYNRNRPDTTKLGVFYIVSSRFVQEWRRFVKEPGRCDTVREINNSELICAHDKFKYPLSFVKDFLNGDTDEMGSLITTEEWNFIQGHFVCDREIKVTVMNADAQDKVTYEPDLCTECAEAWVEQEFKKQFEYDESPITVIKREKGEAVDSDDDDEKDTKDQVSVTGKREPRKVDPDAWKNGFAANNGNRRSQRPRSSKGERVYRVSSSITIKELKSKICQDFKALLSDQHLFHNNIELSSLQKTLADYQIPARAKIYLEIDTEENGGNDEPPAAELGFRGTLLIGGNAFSDTRSPVQN